MYFLSQSANLLSQTIIFFLAKLLDYKRDTMAYVLSQIDNFFIKLDKTVRFCKTTQLAQLTKI